MFSSTKLVALAALLATSVLASPCTRTYTVQAGDYCDHISAHQNSSTYQLATVNHPAINEECDNLIPGQVLCLGYEKTDCKTTYVVIPNDTLEVISDKFKMNTTMLMGNNPQLLADSSNLYIGEVLCVAETVIVPPAAPGNPPGSKPPPYAYPTNPKPTDPAVPQPPKPEPPVAKPPVNPKPPVDPKPETPEDDEDLPWCDEL